VGEETTGTTPEKHGKASDKKQKGPSNAVMVIGAGIAGIQASLDLADRGKKVYLIEQKPTIGGRMALLDKTFPTNDCSICILAPKLNECQEHENIEIMTCADVIGLKGDIADLKAKVRKRARFVDTDKCTGCGECIDKCPRKSPNEYNEGLDKRKAIYIPFPQAVPRAAVIDPGSCIYLEKGKCRACEKACEANAIDLEMKDQEMELDVEAVVVASGFEVFDPSEMKEYGFGRSRNVVTAMQYERLICASGPTGGHIHLEPDHREPKEIAFIQCVGSRDIKHDRSYCSAVCCMHATKEAILAREHYPDVRTHVFYIDLRSVGKGFQEYVDRGARDYGIDYIRARPGRITEDPESLRPRITYLDMSTQKNKELEVDLVVLATALLPSSGNKALANILDVDLEDNGFFKCKDPVLYPVDSTRAGVFITGYCQSPQDIPECVIQSSGVAARVAEAVQRTMKGER